MKRQNLMWSDTSITLMDALKQEPTLLDEMVLSNSLRTIKFRAMFKAVYGTKSIAGETIELFKIYITNTFNEYREYYEEKLDVYEKELNYDNGIVIHREHSDDGSSSASMGNSTSNENYDLPNKTTEGEYITDKSKGTSKTNSNDSYEKDIVEDVTGGVNVVEQRDKMLDYIRSIYKEFVDRFWDCFSVVYA